MKKVHVFNAGPCLLPQVAIDNAIEAQIKRECDDDEAKKKAEEDAKAEEEAKKKAAEEEEQRQLEEQEQRFREQQALRLRYQARRLNNEILESLEY